MEKELFWKSYNQEILRFLERFHKEECFRISQIMKYGNHYEILEEQYNFKDLAKIKMLIEEYPKIEKNDTK